MTTTASPTPPSLASLIEEAEKLMADWDANTQDYDEPRMLQELAEGGFDSDAAALWSASPRLVRALLDHLIAGAGRREALKAEMTNVLANWQGRSLFAKIQVSDLERWLTSLREDLT